MPFFSNRPNLSVCLSVCPELGLATFLQPARRLASAPAFFECEWVTSCCTSVPHLGSPPGGAPPAQGNTRLCSYPSVLPPSVWVSPGWAEMDDTKYHEWMDHRLQYPSDGSNFEISSDVLQQHIVHLRVAGTGACGMTTAWYLLGMVCRFLYLSNPLIINDTFYRETVPG